jgi:uncharacterized membrane protein SpoIIM required for sporulation
VDRDTFIARRSERWQALERLVDRGPRALSGQDVFRLGRLYRDTSSDLALARRDMPGDRVTLYLNNLVARAHPLMYQAPAADSRSLLQYASTGVPRAYRRALPYTAAAFLVFLLAALISGAAVSWDRSNADLLLPGTAQHLRTFLQHHQLWIQGATSDSPVAANFIMTNNIRVAFLAFAGGLLVAVPTLLVMAYNGIMLGTILAMVSQYGLGEQLWAFIVPHGVVELSVIFMAGGAGMMVGDAILRPGLRTRGEALAEAVRAALPIVVACVPLLGYAGTVEAFLSPSNLPDALKFALGTASGLVLYGYLLLAGRDDDEWEGAGEDAYSFPRPLISR